MSTHKVFGGFLMSRGKKCMGKKVSENCGKFVGIICIICACRLWK